MTEQTPAPREKLINAPLAPVILAASIPVLYFLQTLTPNEGLAWAFRPAPGERLRWEPGRIPSWMPGIR